MPSTRRTFLQSSAALATGTLLTGCKPPMTAKIQPAPALPFYDAVPPLTPIRAHEDRLFKITVCLRPFRAVGPRIEAERIGDKLVVHNYGHGGSGWSLSWGSGERAVSLALSGTDPTQTDVAVIGCGALGLTSAILLQRAGVRSVTIYAKDRPSESRSFRATGSWTPFSRIALQQSVSPTFAAEWEKMTRASWHHYQNFLGLAGTPVEFSDRYYLSDPHPAVAEQQKIDADPLRFVNYRDLVADMYPPPQDLPPGTHPFPTKWARRRSELMFNITAYSHQLTEDFLLAGGRIVTREFHTPAELLALPQPILLHSTGYGARALFADNSITPVRGQIGWLIPQPDVNYGLVFDNLNILGRRDGIVVQLSELGEASGWNSSEETPDRREAEEGVRQLRAMYDRMFHS